MTAVVPTITGSTRLFAILGDPVAQVRAPTLLNPVFSQVGLDAALVPVHVHASDLANVVRGLQRITNLDGMLVTIPHKVAICRFADELSPTVILTGCANALRRNPDGRWLAENFDGVGFVRGLSSAGHSARGKRVCLLGAGGAGCAIAAALLAAGARQLDIYDTDDTRSAALVSRLRERWPGQVISLTAPRVDTANLVVNATPLGLRPDDPLPFAPGDLPAGSVVADIIMEPRNTPLLQTAAALGHQVHHGIHMLEPQIDSYRGFFDIR